MTAPEVGFGALSSTLSHAIPDVVGMREQYHVAVVLQSDYWRLACMGRYSQRIVVSRSRSGASNHDCGERRTTEACAPYEVDLYIRTPRPAQVAVKQSTGWEP